MACDGTQDIAANESEDLINRIVTLAGSELAAHYGEHDHDLLFYSFEVLFALEAHGLFSWGYCPEPAAARTLKQSFLERWNKHYRTHSGADEDFIIERQGVIVATFDRFITGCENEHVDYR